MDEFFLKEEEKLNIQHLLDNQGMIFFFKKDDDYFGAGEDSRVIFARIKHPDKETPSGWADEASFTADNLTKMMQGDPCQRVFNKKDLKKIKILDKDEILDQLKDVAHESGEPVGTIKVIKISRLMPHKNNRDDAPNFVRADEE